jgi:hypothetical protein
MKSCQLIVDAEGDVEVAQPDGSNSSALGPLFGNLKSASISPGLMPPFVGEWNVGLSNDKIDDAWLLLRWG